MRGNYNHIIALLLLVMLHTLSIQGQTRQEEYLRSTPPKEEFNQKTWNKVRKRMVNEARAKEQDADVNDFDLQPGDVTTESEHDGDFYNYDEEGREGEFAEYENFQEQELDELEYKDDGGSDYFHPDEEDQEYGENQYHPEEREHYYNRPRKQTSSGVGGLGGLQYVLIALLVVLLAFLVYQLFIKTSVIDKGKKVIIPLEELEPTEIAKTELEIMLEKALADGNYREAVRIYFIFIIKDLSEREWIKWEKRKTNISYLMEMRGRSQYDLFNEAVAVFEYVWYGNYKIEKSDFEEIEPKFKSLLKSLDNK